jgi:hypothetical protein
MIADLVYRTPGHLVYVGAAAVMGVVAWWGERPLMLWAAVCFGIAMLVFTANGIVLQWRHRRWNDRGVAALRAGELDVPPTPRGSGAILALALAVTLGFVLAGGVLVALDEFRWFAEPSAAAAPAARWHRSA